MTAEALARVLSQAAENPGPVIVLTGAGISAESGIPTFRGPEGYWRIGSRNYRPEELATFVAFRAMPDEVWSWYLYRRGVCRQAMPNAAHHALVDLERVLGDRFLLVTQNVDGLHLRAGNSAERTYSIHGNIDFCRLPSEHPRIRSIPEEIDLDWDKDRRLESKERALLYVDEEWSRPHVLFFDESYDEELFRFESSLEAMTRAAMLIVVGTSGATTLPSHMVSLALTRSVPLIVINKDPSPFSEAAERSSTGLFLSGSASEWVPEIRDLIARNERPLSPE